MPFPRLMSVNPELNALIPMLVTELGMVTCCSILQPMNASLPIVLTEFAIVIFVNPDDESKVWAGPSAKHGHRW